jgi:hypothetical protein
MQTPAGRKAKVPGRVEMKPISAEDPALETFDIGQREEGMTTRLDDFSKDSECRLRFRQMFKYVPERYHVECCGREMTRLKASSGNDILAAILGGPFSRRPWQLETVSLETRLT